MEWFYAEAGRQLGPVSDEQLQEMLRSGKLTSTSLVWRQGMANWQPYGTIQTAGVTAPPSAPAGDSARCAECGRTFPTNDMVHYRNSWVCAACKPIFFQRVTEGAAPPTSMSVWRSDKLLVANKEAVLPNRCVKCNKPAQGQPLTRTLHWHSPYLYFLVLLNLLIYAVVAVIVRKKARIQIGLCDAHRSKRKVMLATGWLGSLGGLGLLFGGAVNSQGLLAFVGFLVFLTGLIVGANSAPVTAKRIDKEHVWVKGVCGPYLDSLPEWTEGF